MKALILVALLLLAMQAEAQTSISGVLKSKASGLLLPNINVSVKDKKTAAILGYGVSDAKGRYLIKFTSAADSLLLSVSGFNIGKQNRSINNKSQEQHFDLSPEAIKLKEVKVNPPKIRKLNDTINYLVDGFKDQNDRTIGDVLKKMPGIEVKGDGSILYNNKPINKFYIEDRDLLQGRYGLATNNLEAKDVSTVQVLENHQPVKALKNREFSDDAALNIKLKDHAKGVLVANGKAAAGLSPFLWNNELFSMYFNKARQNMNTYKGNNTGDDPGADLTSFYSDAAAAGGSTSLAVQSPANPAISQKRYLFNRAHALSLNNMWALSKENQINANFSYLDDRQDRSSFARSSYYLPGDSLLSIEERLNSRDHLHQLDAAFLLNKNKDDYYLDNSLSFKGKWNQTAATVMNQDTVYQYLRNPSYALNNNLSLIRNYKNTSVKIYSTLAFNRVPQYLDVQPVLYADLFSVISAPVTMQQNLVQTQINANNSASLGYKSENWIQNYAIGFRLNRRNLRSALQQQGANGLYSSGADSLQNNLELNKYEFYLSPDYTFSKNQLKASIALPLSYNYLQTDNKLIDGKNSLNRIFFKPSFSITYNYNLFLAIVGRAKLDNSLGDISNIFTGYILQSYRSLIRNDGQLPEQRSQSYSIDFNYRHPLYAVFINLGTSYSRNKANLLFGYDYQGILNLKKTYLIPNVSDHYSLYGRLSKGIDAIGGAITFDASFDSSNSIAISQDQLLALSNQFYQFKPGFNARFKKWLSLNYSFQFNQSKNIIRNNNSQFEPIRSSLQRSALNIFPFTGLTLNLAHEYFYSSAIANGNRIMNFADAGLKYRSKNMEYSINCSNIFNARQYISASYNSTNTYYSAYNLRPTQVLMAVRFKIK